MFGRGKELFWQQASTNLLKFVILLHQTSDVTEVMANGSRRVYSERDGQWSGLTAWNSRSAT